MTNKDNFSDNLTPVEKAKLSILANRLGINLNEAIKLNGELSYNLSKTLNIPVSAISADLELAGREMDLIFSVHKSNLPRK